MLRLDRTKLSETLASGKRFTKKQTLAHLPDWALTPLKKRHYLSVIRTISTDYDPDFIVLQHLLKSGDHVIDLGAHVGACTKFLSDLVGNKGRVYSVEPFPSTFEILQANVQKLGLSNVELFNCAVSNASGKLTMEVPTFRESGESFYDARLIPAGSTSSLRQAEVEVTTVDTLFAHLPHAFSFIKCDVEGQELQTLWGAAKVIEKDRPALLLEISLMSATTHDEVRQLLGAYNYQEFWFKDRTLKLWEMADKPVDVFFFQPAHLEAAKRTGLM